MCSVHRGTQFVSIHLLIFAALDRLRVLLRRLSDRGNLSDSGSVQGMNPFGRWCVAQLGDGLYGKRRTFKREERLPVGFRPRRGLRRPWKRLEAWDTKVIDNLRARCT